ncbi:EAL domain-containing protein [Rhodoferax sp.]|uniref:bifunctional diguanylate cyclase/phosphodiesterase n=1 Tax=Rhodoferax sp. TaxID=50421 RepID=UPI002605CACC|nr:EAL domain-containing protein [Rhodoferax sp.]MDD2808488.1 EAL domain-containing protein [Rhodoferax sp.]
MFAQRLFKSPRMAGVLVFLLAALLTSTVSVQSEQHRQQAERERVQALAADHAQRLQENLLQALSATQALAALVQVNQGDIPNFDALATRMLAHYPGVSAMALEPQGVVRRIVPLQGNGDAIGLDVLNHPARAKEAHQARDTGQITLAGPFELVQGGLGALGFFPVFLNDDQGQPQFWGFTNVVIRLPQALGPAQFEQLVKQGLHYALWRSDPATQQRQVMAQSGAVPSDAVDVVLRVPNAQWTLSVTPNTGWADPVGLLLKLALGGLLSALLALVVKQWLVAQALAQQLQGNVGSQAQQITALNHQLQATLDAMPDLLFEISLQGRYLACHTPRSALLAAPAADLVGKNIADVLPAPAAAVCLRAIEEAARTGFSQGQEIELQLADGSHWFELSVAHKAPLAQAEPTFIVLSRDVTERKHQALKLARLTQLYAALSQCNQAIVRCTNEAELFPILCRDAVNFGGMKMAWIGVVSPTGAIEPVASFGQGIEYVAHLDVCIDAAVPQGRGPVGSAARENKPVWFQDFQHDPATAPWHERAKQFGWGAVASMPLHRKGQVVGVFSVYAAHPHAFDEAAQNLLLEMTMDISFALDHFEDEAQRQTTLRALQDSEERYRTAFVTSPDSININRLSDGMYLDVNQGFERITGWAHAEVVGKTSQDINIWHDMADRQRLVEGLTQHGQVTNLEADFVRQDGSLVHGLMSAAVVRFQDVACILSITRDITEKRQTEEKLKQLALFDQLTGLPNRTDLQNRFEFALSLAQRHSQSLCLMFMDIDHFKNVNDTLGHSVGDQLLVEMARRLNAQLRTEDTLSRLGGDEFILLLPNIDHEGAQQVALKLLAAASLPCQIEPFELVNTLSIGLAMYPQDGQDFETLSKNADTAMYRVKHAARNGFCFFTPEMQANSVRSLQLVNALHHALARHEMQVHYQPQVAMQDGRVIGVEALLRWQSPELGLVMPAEFVPIAEDSGQILEIGEWVLRSAVNQLKSWMDQGLPPVVMAVNLSAVQFRHADLLHLVTGILAQAGVPPELLELELTEAIAMDHPDTAISIMNRLHEHGIRMSIDDFGTGYSSLSYLKKFKVYKLKIDQSFVRDLSHDADDKAIVTAIINLASSMGLQTIAEGVETASQLAFLRLQGCDEVQGYYFSHPLSADAFAAYVRQQPPLA